MMMALLRAVFSGRGDSQLLLSLEQALPLKTDWLSFNRFRARGERTFALGNRLRCLVCAKGALLGLPPTGFRSFKSWRSPCIGRPGLL